MSKSLKELKNRFISTMGEVSFTTGLTISEINRDDYTRITVDTGMMDRLNKEELNLLGGFNQAKKNYLTRPNIKNNITQPKCLILDIESSPLEVYTWGVRDQVIGLNQVIKDWSVMSWAAKWLDDSEDNVMYMDTRKEKNPRNDRKVLLGMKKLLDQADVVITQNGIRFDIKKLNSRFVMNNIEAPSSFKHIDTLVLAKKYFGFTSNKLEYMTDKLCTKYKKLKHGKFPGMSLWIACLNGNQEAWEEMEKYNKYDVLSLEELYYKLIPWDNSIDFNLYHDVNIHVCKCGSTDFKKSGFFYSLTGKFQKYKCTKCGSETRDTNNLFSTDKKKSLRRKVM